MALTVTTPPVWNSRIIEASDAARTSAARLCASTVLIPPFPDVSRLRRVSILTTVVRCHLPPPAPGIPLRFNSFARTRRETKPAATSFRMVGSIARARASAARLPPNTPRIPVLPGEFSPRTGSIGRLWPRLARRRPMLRLCRGPDLFGQQQVDRARLIRAPPTSEGPPRNLDPDGPLTCRYIRGQIDRSTAAMTDDRFKTESAGRPWLKQGGSREVARRAGVDCRERSTPAGEASLNPVPPASRELLPLVHYCFNKPASAYLRCSCS